MLFKKNRWIIGFIFGLLMSKTVCMAAEDSYLESQETRETERITEDESNSFNVSMFSFVEAETTEFAYTGKVQTYKAPFDGLYKLEVWGGQGASRVSNVSPGGKGGYSVGYIELKKDTPLYIVVGQNGNGLNGGYNGGGYGGCYGDSGDSGYGGGGCTHIATTNRGVLSNYSSYRKEVLLVAGGGGGQGGYSGRYSQGGSGGGITGGNGYHRNGGIVSNAAGSGEEGVGGSQTGAGKLGGFGYGGYGEPYNSGGGGGGWYGGGPGSVHCAGGGGSGYIGGVPEIEFSGEIFTPIMENGVRSGHGYAKITMIKKLVAVTFQESELEVIERKQVVIKADVEGVVSHTWQMQKKTDDVPFEELWEDIDMEALGMEEKVEIENRSGSIRLTFPAQMCFSEYWFRLCIQGEEENMESAPCLLTIIPLKIDYLEYRGVQQDLEAGTTITTSDFEIWAVYNNSDIEVLLREDEELLDRLLFVDGTEYESQLILRTVSDSKEITMQLLHEDHPLPVTFSVSVYDLTEPVVENVTINGIQFYANETLLTIEIVVEAVDNSDSSLEYWYERKSDGYCSEVTGENTFSVILNKNDIIELYIRDESGNVIKYEKEICYVDTQAPVIKDISVSPEKVWINGEAKITVIAEDELSGLHDRAYSFDGGATWQENNVFVLEQSQILKILVRDKVENISDFYEVEVHKKKADNGYKAKQETVFQVRNPIPYEEVLTLEAEKRVLEVYNNLPVEKHIVQEDAEEIIREDIEQSLEEERKPDATESIEHRKQNVEEIKIPLANKQEDKTKLPKVIMATTAATATATGMFFCFFIIFRRADVYYINELLQEEYVTFCPIRRKKNGYYIKLHPKHLNGIGNKRFVLRVSKGFAKKKDGKYLDVVFEKRVVYTLCMKEKMYFYLTVKL